MSRETPRLSTCLEFRGFTFQLIIGKRGKRNSKGIYLLNDRPHLFELALILAADKLFNKGTEHVIFSRRVYESINNPFDNINCPIIPDAHIAFVELLTVLNRF